MPWGKRNLSGLTARKKTSRGRQRSTMRHEGTQPRVHWDLPRAFVPGFGVRKTLVCDDTCGEPAGFAGAAEQIVSLSGNLAIYLTLLSLAVRQRGPVTASGTCLDHLPAPPDPLKQEIHHRRLCTVSSHQMIWNSPL